MIAPLFFFGLAVALGAALFDILNSLIFLIAAALACAAVFIYFGAEKHKRLFAALFGLSLGAISCFAFNTCVYQPIMTFEGKICELKAVMEEPVSETDRGGFRYVFKVSHITDGKQESSRSFSIYGYSNTELPIELFDEVIIKGELRSPNEPVRIGEFDSKRYLSTKGIYLTCSLYSPLIVKTGEKRINPLMAAGFFIRGKIEEASKLLPERTAPLMQAILTGNKQSFDDDVRQDLARAGTMHIFATSGMHVSILAGILIFILSLAGLKKRTATVLAMAFIVIYMAVGGFSPSILRAGFMFGIVGLSQIVRRNYDPFAALGLSMAVIVLLSPLSVFSVSFLLSFSACIGMLFAAKLFKVSFEGKTLIKKSVNLFRNLTVTTTAASIFNAPALIYFFGGVAMLTVFANLLTLPLLSVIFALCLMLTIFSGFFPLAKVLSVIITGLFDWTIFVARFFSRELPSYAQVSSIYPMVFAFFLIAVFVIAAFMRPFKKGDKKVIAACLLACSLVFYVVPKQEIIGGGDVLISFVDVGQGLSMVVKTPEKSAIFDCGSSSTMNAGRHAGEVLKSLRADPDYFFFTHLHSDHINGAKALLLDYFPNEIYLPEVLDNEFYQEVLEFGVRQEIISPEEYLKIELSEGVSCSVYPSGMLEKEPDDNGPYIAYILEIYGIIFLITGDMETPNEIAFLREIAPDVDILQVGHHGSKTSSQAYFLEILKPELAVISVGAENSYGHPSPEVLERYESYGTTVLRTDESGTVTILIEQTGEISIYR